jgi:small subunit ribosomal protein S21
VEVTARPGEPFENLLRRFKQGVERGGILGEYKRHQTFMSRGEKARAKMKRAERKRRTRMARRPAAAMGR